MDKVCTLPELRNGLEIAQMCARHHIGFVVMPVFAREEYVRLSLELVEKLERIAQAAEKESR